MTVSGRRYHALMNYLDGMVGNVVSMMRDNGMWANTVMVWSSGKLSDYDTFE